MGRGGILGGAGGAGGAGGTFEEAAAGFFTKSRGSRRAEAAIGQAIRSVASGDIAGAIGGLGSKAGGVGIGTVAGIDAMIMGYQKWAQAIDEVHARQLKVASLTGATVFGDVGSAKTSLSSVTEELSSLRQKQLEKSDNKSWVHQDYVIDFFTGDSTAGRDKEKEALRKKAGEDIGVMARNQEQLNDAEKESLFGSSRQAEILKERVKHSENLLEIGKNAAAAGVEFSPATEEAKSAENTRSGLAEDAINRKADLEKAKGESAIDSALFARDHPEAGAQRGFEIQQKLGLIGQEMGGPISDDRRTQLSAEHIGLENEQVRNAFEHRNDPGAALWTKERGKEAEFKAFAKDYERTGGLRDAHFDMTGNLIGGTDRMTGKQVDLTDKAMPGGGMAQQGGMAGTAASSDIKAAAKDIKDSATLLRDALKSK